MSDVALNSRLRSLLKVAEVSGNLILADLGLHAIPPPVLEIHTLRRLDLGSNEIRHLGEDVSRLTSLEELILTNNPLSSLPASLRHCRRLRVLDVRDTRIRELPKEVSRLPLLRDLRISTGGGLAPAMRTAMQTHGAAGVVEHLAREDEREGLRAALDRRLRLEVYTEAAETEDGAHEVTRLVNGVMLAFDNTTELRSVVRNAPRLFPDKIEHADVAKVREAFSKLAEDTERKRMAAQLELKLRAIYFDRIRLEDVEPAVHSIVRSVDTLRDMRFLLAFAKDILPDSPEAIRGTEVKASLLRLREKRKEARLAAMHVLARALSTKYPDREPDDINSMVKQVVKPLKDPNQIRALASDVDSLFPTEFATINPRTVLKRFQESQII